MNATRRELRRQSVQIWNLDVRVPTEGRPASVVWDRIDADFLAVYDLAERLENDRRPITVDNPEELVVRSRATEVDVKAEHVAIEGQCRGHVATMKKGEMPEMVGRVVRHARGLLAPAGAGSISFARAVAIYLVTVRARFVQLLRDFVHRIDTP